MNLSQREIDKLMKFVLKQLKDTKIKIVDEGKLVSTVINIINQNIEDEKSLEADALKLLKKFGEAGGAGLDREKALRMIKKKLADERKFIL